METTMTLGSFVWILIKIYLVVIPITALILMKIRQHLQERQQLVLSAAEKGGVDVDTLIALGFVQQNWSQVARGLYQATHPDGGGTNLEFIIARKAVEEKDLLQVTKLAKSYGVIIKGMEK